MTRTELLLTWAKALQAHQLLDPSKPSLDGGLWCDACQREHGRSGDATLAFLYAARVTGDMSYVKAAEGLFWWTERNMTMYDGSNLNDAGHPWQGITIFATNNWTNCLTHFADLLTPATKQAMLARIRTAIGFIADFVKTRKTNTNYFLAAATMFVNVGHLLQDNHWTALGQALMAQYATLVQPDGMIIGEGCAHGKALAETSPRGGYAIDLGYNLEENLGSLVEYYHLTKDANFLPVVRRALDAALYFIQDDGGIDNSFGLRNAKWTYWGSRTSDGCQLTFGYFDTPRYQQAAALNLQQLAACTHDGLLAGGPMLVEQGETICLHHTVCHAKALALALLLTSEPQVVSAALPDHTNVFDHGLRATVRWNGWYFSTNVSDYAYAPDSTPTGGTPTLLSHQDHGPILAATMTVYKMTEPSNMQYPRRGAIDCGSVQLQTDSATSLRCQNATLTGDEATHTLTTTGVLADGTGYRFVYRVDATGFHLHVQADRAATLQLPLITGKQALRRVDAQTVACNGVQVHATSALNQVPASDGNKQFFNPVGGFIYTPLTVAVPADQSVTVDFQVS